MHQSQFGPYHVIRLLGQGGMGTVYEASDPASGRSVAVKTLPVHLANDEGLRRRFQAEIATLVNLRHPGIAQLIGSGEQGGLPFFVMEFVPGRTLEELLKSGRRFSWQETVAIAQQILPPLKSAHDQGVVHRDLKPANLMFPPAPGGGFHVKLTDFGIAKLFGETGLTRSGVVIGTPEYMAPEQATGLVVDHRADLYSLGLVMFAMLAGRPPFQGAVADVVDCQKVRSPPRVSSLVPEVPPVLDDLIATLLAKTPDARPPNVAVVARQLAALSSQPDPTAAAPQERTAAKRTGDTRVDGEQPVAPGALPQTLAMDPDRADATVHRPVQVGRATTVAENQVRAQHSDRRTGDMQGEGATQPGGSTFETVEDRRLRVENQKKRAEIRDAIIKSIMALMGISFILFVGWWLALKPWPWPDPQAPQRDRDRIIAMLGDPDDLGNPCDAIKTFLERHPHDRLAAEVAQLGRERALQMLHKRSFRRLPTYKPKSQAERLYLEAIRLDDPREEVEKLRGILAIIPARRDGDLGRDARGDPCIVAEQPDDTAWRELAQRQLEIVEPQARQADTLVRKNAAVAKNRAIAILNEAASWQQKAVEAEAIGQAGTRVEAITRRHQLLEDLVQKFADEPAAEDEVAAAKRLLAE